LYRAGCSSGWKTLAVSIWSVFDDTFDTVDEGQRIVFVA
jgi:hypothetical protein